MKIIFGDRGTGKTTELIKLSAKEWLYIVCRDRSAVMNTARMAEDMGLNIPFPLTYEEFVDRKYHAIGLNGFLLDDVDWYLQSLTKVPIIASTITDNFTDNFRDIH